MITLYDYELSGNCFKVRLLLGLLELPYTAHAIDFYPGFEHQASWFLELNPLGQLPVLRDDDLLLCDSQAILVYLASRYDPAGSWYPRQDAVLLGQVSMWLGFADRLSACLSAARLHDEMSFECDIDACRAEAHRRLRILDAHLWFVERSPARWICGGDMPTVADIACFPYVMLSEEAGVAHRDYPAVRRWTDRIRRLPRFVPMSGIPIVPA